MRVTFSGPGISSGSIDARELGRTLVGLADAVHAVQAVKAAPETPRASLTITATGEGSFWVDLALVVESGAVQAAVDALTGKYMDAGLNVSAVVTVVLGAFAYMKRRKGREVTRVAEIPNSDRVKVHHEDGTVEDIPADVWLVAKNSAFQKAAKQTVAPLAKDGIDAMSIETKDPAVIAEPVTIEKTNYRDFQVTDDSEPEPSSRTDEMYVSPVAPNFEHGKSWRLNDGASNISAHIEDDEFLERIDEGLLRVGPKDTFKVLLRTDQEVLDTGKIRTTYTVVQVLRRVIAGEQGEFPLEP